MDVMNMSESYLEGKLLIAAPSMKGSCFEKSVIYLCNHSPEGAMGIIINQVSSDVQLSDVFDQLDIALPTATNAPNVYFGGPVEHGRGFVLHSPDYNEEDTVLMSPSIALTANADILRAMSEERGPENCILALGYAGWTAGQLEQELQDNSWLIAPASPDLVFFTPNEMKWKAAALVEGIDLNHLSHEVGHA